MERTQILSPGRTVRPVLTPDLVLSRLSARSRGRGAGSPPEPSPAEVRGDYQLDGMARPDRVLIPAAVLVPLVAYPDRMAVLLTRRTAHLADHAGQIAFPGGRIEATDADSVAAALRETEEEVGLPSSRVEVIGRLATWITVTGFEITPVVGLIRPPYPLRPDPFEVAEIFEVPLDFVLDPANHERHSREWKGRQRSYFALPYGDRYIWGATAGMLVNLAEILGEA